MTSDEQMGKNLRSEGDGRRENRGDRPRAEYADGRIHEPDETRDEPGEESGAWSWEVVTDPDSVGSKQSRLAGPNPTMLHFDAM